AAYQSYRQAVDRLRQLESVERQAQGQIGRASQSRDWAVHYAHVQEAMADLNAAVERIRKIERYEHFFSPPVYADVVAAARPGWPLVYLLVTAAGSLALIVLSPSPTSPDHRPSTVNPVWLDNFRSEDLNHVLLKQKEDIKQSYLWGTTVGETKVLVQNLDYLWPVLRERLLVPLMARVQALGYDRILLVSTGTLSLLPLPAIVIDSLTFALAPSARAMQLALKLVQERAIGAPVILGVGNPTADDQQRL